MTRERYAVAKRPAEIGPDGLGASSKPDFFGPEWSLLKRNEIVPVASKYGLESVILLETSKKEVLVKNLTEVSPKIDEIKKDLAYNPSKKSKQLIDEKGRHILYRRARRGSRCLAQPDHEPTDCQGRKHLKKSQSAQEKQLSPNTPENKNTPKKRKRSRGKVVLNGKQKIK